jgi:hypothetical protein
LVEGDAQIFLKFRKSLEDAGCVDIHAESVRENCLTLKGILKVDLLKQKSIEKALSSLQSSLLVNPKTKATIILKKSPMREPRARATFLVQCYSDNLKSVESNVGTLKKIIIQKVGLGKEKIQDGDENENANRHCIDSLTETQRSQLVKAVKTDMLNVFVSQNTRNVLRKLVSFPIKVFREDMFGKRGFGELDLAGTVSSGIFNELFSPTCKKCAHEISPPSLFDSKEDITPVLEKKTLVCPSCGSKLDLENTLIMRYVRFSKLGLEMAKGLWLEAYVYSMVIEAGIPKTNIAVCACHGKDELDMVFTDGTYLYVCECKDKVVGQNDVYILAMKTNRISADEKLGATADKVLMISTEPISKDILPEEKVEDDYEEIDYIPLSGDLEAIRKKLVGLVEQSKREYKKKRLRDLTRHLIGGLSLEGRYIQHGRRYLPNYGYERMILDDSDEE